MHIFYYGYRLGVTIDTVDDDRWKNLIHDYYYIPSSIVTDGLRSEKYCHSFIAFAIGYIWLENGMIELNPTFIHDRSGTCRYDKCMVLNDD